MKLRYILEGQYLPQFSNDEGKTWEYFTADNIPIGLQKIAQSLGVSRKFDDNQWYYENTKKVFFMTELKAGAFLGAANVVFNSQPRNYD